MGGANGLAKGIIMLKNKGFTLLEILLAALIFSIGVGVLSSLLGKGIFSLKDVENTTIALNMAQGKMEEIKTSFDKAIDGQEFSETHSGRVFSGVVELIPIGEVTGHDQDLQQVKVRVNWEEHGGETQLSLTSLAVKINL